MDLQSDLLLGITGYVSDHQMTDLQHPKLLEAVAS